MSYSHRQNVCSIFTGDVTKVILSCMVKRVVKGVVTYLHQQNAIELVHAMVLAK